MGAGGKTGRFKSLETSEKKFSGMKEMLDNIEWELQRYWFQKIWDN